eukprot:Phypoly_transcript_07575.p1 GENE.Phypoly_transcript_07575~~Phypoly_transcript_07575.p1  ORF type:complete len:383 (+),score=56.64 Phypoly_transcript_07575:239-1387(+)
MKRKLKLTSKKRSKGQKQKKSREQEQACDPTASVDFKQLQETVNSMRMVLTTQLLQTSTQLCQGKFEQAGKGEISRLADAITKLAEVTQLAMNENSSLSSHGKELERDQDELETNATLTKAEREQVQKFCREKNVKYETEFDEAEFSNEFRHISVQRFRDYIPAYLGRFRWRKTADIYDAISGLYPKFSYTGLPDNASERLEALKEMLGCDDANQDTIISLLAEACLDNAISASDRAFTRMIIFCIVSHTHNTQRPRLYSNLLAQERSMDVKSIGESAESPAESPAKSPAKSIIESPAKSIIEPPAESIIESPAESIIESPSESIIESPMESTTESTTEKVAKKARPTKSTHKLCIESEPKPIAKSLKPAKSLTIQRAQKEE